MDVVWAYSSASQLTDIRPLTSDLFFLDFRPPLVQL